MTSKIDAEGNKIVLALPRMEKDKRELVHQYVDNIGEVIHFGFEKRKINSVIVKADMMIVTLGKEEEKQNGYYDIY